MTVSRRMVVNTIMVIVILKLIQSSSVGVDDSEPGCSHNLYRTFGYYIFRDNNCNCN